MASDSRDNGFRSLLIRRKWLLAKDIHGFELVDPGAAPLAPFEAGGHVTVETPAGIRRRFSLANDPAEVGRYFLGVKAERPGRGGSASLVDGTAQGDTIPASAPSNDFALVDAPEYLFIAGGIGITPILSMLCVLRRNGGPAFSLVYCTRDADHTAFLDELSDGSWGGQVTIHHDDGDPQRMLDLWPLLEKPGRAHVYCCGPRPMMDDVRDMSGHWPSGAIHFEDFATDVQPHVAGDGPFTVRHADSGETVDIPADATILETLRKRGHRLPSSCESGTCGTCRTELVAGEADHRDLVLAPDERHGHIMICVSRARSDELVLRW
jgi:phthalate 4,5-dioxygenase reductase subunit